MSPQTIHFPPPVNGKGHEEEAPVKAPVLAKPEGPAGGSLPAIVIWGRMMHTARHLNDQLKYLPKAEADYHGTLRMLVTASLAIEADAKRLLAMIQTEGGNSGLT